MTKTSEQIGKELAEKTLRELGLGKYGKLREFTGKEIRASALTYETFIELVNKVDYLLRRTVERKTKTCSGFKCNKQKTLVR